MFHYVEPILIGLVILLVLHIAAIYIYQKKFCHLIVAGRYKIRIEEVKNRKLIVTEGIIKLDQFLGSVEGTIKYGDTTGYFRGKVLICGIIEGTLRKDDEFWCEDKKISIDLDPTRLMSGVWCKYNIFQETLESGSIRFIPVNA